MPGEQHEAVEPQVGDLGDDADVITVLRRHHRLGRLLPELLQHAVLVAREQRGDVGVARLGALARLDRRREARQDFGVRRVIRGHRW